MPIRSDQIPSGSPDVRGVHWADAEIVGSRTLRAYDHSGNVALELRMPAQYADDASVRTAWAWLNSHCPKPPECEEEDEAPDDERAAPIYYPPLRLIKPI